MDSSITHWRPNIYLFLTSQFLTGITSMIVQYAIIWYLTKETGSATVLSFATILGMLPMVLLSPFVGPLIDRWNKKGLLIVPDIVAALFAIILSISGTFFNAFPLWLIFISLLMRSIAQTFQMPTIQAVIPTMVPEKEITRVNGQLGMVQSANMIIAPALGAMLFAIIPMKFLILLDVLGAAIGIGILLFVKIPSNEKIDDALHVLHNTKLGVSQLVKNKGLWYITLIGAAFTLFLYAVCKHVPVNDHVLLPGYRRTGRINRSYLLGRHVGWRYNHWHFRKLEKPDDTRYRRFLHYRNHYRFQRSFAGKPIWLSLVCRFKCTGRPCNTVLQYPANGHDSTKLPTTAIGAGTGCFELPFKLDRSFGTDLRRSLGRCHRG